MRWTPVLPGFLLLLSAWNGFAVASTAQEPTDWSFEDPAGDQQVGATPVPTTPYSQHTDLRGIRISAEDEISINFTFKVAALKVQARPDPGNAISYKCGGTSHSSGGSPSGPTAGVAYYTLSFALAGQPQRFSIGARILGENTNANPASVFVAQSAFAYFCVAAEDAGGRLRDGKVQPAEVSLDEANSAIHIRVLKDAFLGRLPPPRYLEFRGNNEPAPKSLNAGDVLSNFVAHTSIPATDRIVCCSGASTVADTMPNTGKSPDYAFRATAANQQVALTIQGGARVLAVAPGREQAITLNLENRADAKRLLILSYDVRDDKGDSQGFTVLGPTSMTMPPQEVRNFTVTLKAPATPDLAGEVRLFAKGGSTGRPGEIAMAVARLEPSIVLGPGANTLYFHTMHRSPFDAYPEPANDALCSTVAAFGCGDPYLSPIEQDPRADKPDEIPIFMFPQGTGEARGGLSDADTIHALPLPVAFAPGQPVEVRLRMQSNAPMDGVTARVVLSYASPGERWPPGSPLGEGSAQGSIQPTGSFITVPVTVSDPKGPLLQAGTHLHMGVELRVPAGAGSLSAQTTGVKLIGRETRLVLPLTEVPDELVATAKGAFQLQALGDREDFLNPEEARLYNVSLINQSPTNQTAHLTATVVPATWTAQVLPGHEFRLQAGDAIRIGLLLRAPASAAEGERGVVTLNATDANGGVFSLRFTGVATRGVDLADESDAFRADEDAKDRLQGITAKGQPGFAVWMALAAGVFLAIGRRRTAS